jgi:hypothetical protein
MENKAQIEDAELIASGTSQGERLNIALLP